MKARITVYPRREILDPQGKAIRDALARHGFDEVTEVRAGKSFEVELREQEPGAARALLERLCNQVLANPLMESFEIELLPQEERP